MADTERITVRHLNDVLTDWHFDFDGMEEGEQNPHGSFSDSVALTHCTCWGAGFRVAEPLVAEIERLRAVLEHITRMDVGGYTAYGMASVARRALDSSPFAASEASDGGES